MSILKRYYSKTNGNLTFPCDYLGRTVMVEIRLPLNRFDTEDEKMQAAIESCNYYKSGKVGMKVLRSDVVKSANNDASPKAVVKAVDSPVGACKDFCLDTEASPIDEIEDIGKDDDAVLIPDPCITSVGVVGVDPISEPIADVSHAEIESFNEITSVQDVAAILRREPYRIHSSKLRTPEAIKAIVDDLRLDFPNVVF